MSWALDAFMNGLRDMAAYDLAYTKRDILLLQFALISDAHRPHLTPERRQEALEALAKLEAYRDRRQEFIDGNDLRFVHTSKSNVTVLTPGDVGLVDWDIDPT